MRLVLYYVQLNTQNLFKLRLELQGIHMVAGDCAAI